MSDELTTYYVTFGLGTFMRDHYQPVKARSPEIVMAYMDKHYPKLWCVVLETVPRSGKCLSMPQELYYRRAEDV